MALPTWEKIDDDAKRAGDVDDLQLYTGQRTKKCAKIMDAMCTDVRPILINRGTLTIDGPVLLADTATRFAIADGFKDHAAMRSVSSERTRRKPIGLIQP